MSFQWIIDSAETISMDRRQVVASTTARDGTTRAVSRGGQVWKFEVKFPDGVSWTDYRQSISLLEKLDRVTTGIIKFNNSGHQWMVGYQGNSQNIIGFQATWVQGATSITLTTSPTTTTGYKFRAGDFIQLGTTGKCYTVAADVAYNSNTVPLHRPVIDATQTTPNTLRVAENCEWTVLCTSLPKWTLVGRDQVAFDGAFTFIENLV